MKSYLKTITLAALVTAVAVGATGCGITMRPEEDIKGEMNELLQDVDFNAGNDYKGSLQIMVMGTPPEQDNINAFISSFRAVYPNIDVTLLPSPLNYQEDLVLQHAYATSQDKYDELPDIFWTSNEDVPGYVAKGMLMPISYFVEADKNFSTEPLVENMVKDATFDGELYFMPRDYNQIVMYYNKAIFQKAGVKDPSTYLEDGKVRAMTKTEFVDSVKQIFSWMRSTGETTVMGKKYSQFGYPLEFQPFWNSLNYAVFKGNGAPIVDENGYIDLESDAAVGTLFDFWELVYNDMAARMTDVGMSVRNLFTQQLSAICIDTRSSLSDIIASSDILPGVCEDLGVAPFPNLSNGDYYVGAGCSGYGMYRKTDDPTAAWLFLKHIVSESGQNAFCRTGNGCPVLKSMFEDEDSTWKNIKTENAELYGKLPDDFNHDAFVYRYEQSGVTLEYLDKIPVAAQETVLEQLRIGIMNVVNSVKPNDPQNYTREEIYLFIRQTLGQSGCIATMDQAIDRANAEAAEKGPTQDDAGTGDQNEQQGTDDNESQEGA